jgi:hypothetical protein
MTIVCPTSVAIICGERSTGMILYNWKNWKNYGM